MTNRQVRFASENIEHEIKVDEHSDESSGDEEESGIKKRQFNKFELLDLVKGDGEMGAFSDTETISDTEEDSRSKKESPMHNVADNNNKAASGKKKPRKKRGKGKSNKGTKSNDENPENDLENLAKAINQKSEPSGSLKDQKEIMQCKLLKVDMRNLVSETEIKRIFGKGVVKDDKGRLKHIPGLQRSRLTSGYLDVKATQGLPGPRMELDDAINDMSIGYTTGAGRVSGPDSKIFGSSEPIYFKFVHDPAYQEVHRLFLDAVNRGQPEFVIRTSQAMPTHTESVIQFTHMLRVTEEYKASSEFIEQTLLVFEKGFHPRFNMATGTCRLSYKRPENRTFFITIFMHINACHRRGLRRTPFEYSKLLLSLEPYNDPLMAVQLLDFYAIRSENYDYLIEFYSAWNQLQKLPNLSFSLAMAHFLKSRNTKRTRVENDASLKLADASLQKALLLFPNFIIPLLDACSGEPDSELKKCSYFDYSVYSTKYKLVPETVDVLVALYVKRTYNLWKQKHVLAWLERNVAEMVGKFANGELVDEGKHTLHWSTFTKVAPKNLLRHIVLSDLGMKVPPSASSSSYIDLNPYPPTDSIISYDPSLSATNNSATSSTNAGGSSVFDGLSGLFLRSIMPSFSLDVQNPPPTLPTSSRAHPRNRPPQRPAITVREPQTGGVEVTRVQVDDGLDLDTESIEYSLLIDALRDLPPLGPNSTQETTRQTSGDDEQQSLDQSGSTRDDGNELRRRQTRPS